MDGWFSHRLAVVGCSVVAMLFRSASRPGWRASDGGLVDDGLRSAAQRLNRGELALSPPRGLVAGGELPRHDAEQPALGVRVQIAHTDRKILDHPGVNRH